MHINAISDPILFILCINNFWYLSNYYSEYNAAEMITHCLNYYCHLMIFKGGNKSELVYIIKPININ